MKWFPEKFGKLPDRDPHWDHPDYDTRGRYLDELPDQVDLSHHMHGLVNFIGGPGWLLINPLFLKLYLRLSMRFVFGPQRTFLAGIYYSLAISGLTFLSLGHPGVVRACGVLMIASVSLVLVVAAIRLAMVCLISTPMTIASEIDKGVMHSVFTTPLSDAEIYFGASMPNLVRGLGMLEESVAFILGSAVPFVLFNWPFIFFSLPRGGFNPTMWFTGTILTLIFTIVFLLLSAILVSRAAGLYSLVTGRVGTIFATIGHTIVAWMIALGFGSLIFFLFSGSPGVHSNIRLLSTLLASPFVIAILWFGCVCTGQLGVWALRRARQKVEVWF